MSFLHCHNCDWSQDDFWDKDGYNPLEAKRVEDLKDSLFKDKIRFDSSFFKETGVPFSIDDEGPYCTGQDYVAWELERRARSIRNMKVLTNDDWLNVRSNWKCPECGSDNWDID